MSSALLIIERNEQILSLLYQENRLVQVKVHDDNNKKQNSKTGEDGPSSLPLHAIYIGKVKNVVPSIDAAFVEVCKGFMGFLPMKHAIQLTISSNPAKRSHQMISLFFREVRDLIKRLRWQRQAQRFIFRDVLAQTEIF